MNAGEATHRGVLGEWILIQKPAAVDELLAEARSVSHLPRQTISIKITVGNDLGGMTEGRSPIP